MTQFAYPRRNASFIYDWVSAEDLARLWCSGETEIHAVCSPFVSDGEDAAVMFIRDAIIGSAPLVTCAPIADIYNAETVTIPLSGESAGRTILGLLITWRDRPVIFISQIHWVPNDTSRGYELTVYWDQGESKVVNASDLDFLRQVVPT